MPWMLVITGCGPSTDYSSRTSLLPALSQDQRVHTSDTANIQGEAPKWRYHYKKTASPATCVATLHACRLTGKTQAPSDTKNHLSVELSRHARAAKALFETPLSVWSIKSHAFHRQTDQYLKHHSDDRRRQPLRGEARIRCHCTVGKAVT